MSDRRLDAEMRVDDGAELRRYVETGDQRSGGIRRHSKNDCIAVTKRDGFAAEIERFDPPGAKAHPAQLMLHAHHRASLLQRAERGLDQRRTQPLARNQRTAGPPADGERFTDDRARKSRRSHWRIDVQRREQKRLDQSPIENAFAGDDLADRLARRRPHEPRQRQIIERARSGHAPRGIENPEREAAVIKAQRPAFAARQIGKRKLGRRRTDQTMLGPDAAQIVERSMIARQKKMIAVVDRHADGRVVIRAATAAGKGRGLMDDDLRAT